jgi:uncharacterized FlaG/YvyC family protein
VPQDNDTQLKDTPVVEESEKSTSESTTESKEKEPEVPKWKIEAERKYRENQERIRKYNEDLNREVLHRAGIIDRKDK